MLGKVARTVMGRSWGKVRLPTAQAARVERIDACPVGPREAFFDVVARVAREERMADHLAMAKVRMEHPTLFWSAFPQERKRRFVARPHRVRSPAIHNSSTVRAMLAACA